MSRFGRIILVAAGVFVFGCATVKTHEATDAKPVTPAAAVAAEPAKHVLKRKVAIARFTNETKYGRGFFGAAETVEIGGQASDILTAKLASTGKFLLLDRQVSKNFVDEELAVKAAAAGTAVAPNRKIPADYLIIGSVTEFGRKDESDVGLFSRTKKQTAYAKVSVRIMEVETSRIIFSAEGSGEAFSEVGKVLGMGSAAGYDQTLNDKAISAAISDMVNGVVANLTERPWRSYVLSAETDFTLIIAGGKNQGLDPGDLLAVYLRGKTVKNPQTGTTVELPGKKIGTLRIAGTMAADPIDEVSTAEMTEGSLRGLDLSQVYLQEK